MNRDKWIKDYRTNKNAVWIRCKLTNGQEFNFDVFEGWRILKYKCEKDKLFFSELMLQFRSHCVTIDVDGASAIYLIRSIMGQFGAESKHYYTTGVLKDGKVHKKMWIIPELMVDKEFVDDIEDCFEEALIYDKTRTNG